MKKGDLITVYRWWRSPHDPQDPILDSNGRPVHPEKIKARERWTDFVHLGPPLPPTSKPYPISRLECLHVIPSGHPGGASETLLRAAGGKHFQGVLLAWVCTACGSRWERTCGPPGEAIAMTQGRLQPPREEWPPPGSPYLQGFQEDPAVTQAGAGTGSHLAQVTGSASSNLPLMSPTSLETGTRPEVVDLRVEVFPDLSQLGERGTPVVPRFQHRRPPPYLPPPTPEELDRLLGPTTPDALSFEPTPEDLWQNGGVTLDSDEEGFPLEAQLAARDQPILELESVLEEIAATRRPRAGSWPTLTQPEQEPSCRA